MTLAVDVKQIEGLKGAEVLKLYIKNRRVEELFMVEWP